MRIMFPTDFSPCADVALTHALFHAEAHDAELHIIHGLVHITEDVPYFNVPPDTIEAKMDEVARTRMQEAVEPHRDQPFRIFEENVRGHSASNIILDFAADHDCDLIVMGTHGRRYLQHFLLGSVAEAVARLAPCPVITVRANHGASPLKPVRHLLVPLDFSKLSNLALQWAAYLAEIHRAQKITLLHVIEDYFYPGGVEPGISAIADLVPQFMEQRKKRLECMVDELGAFRESTDCDCMVGRPANTVVKYAREHDVDLIVAGTGVTGGLGRVILGSTVERILRLSPCPVFTFKHFEQEKETPSA